MEKANEHSNGVDEQLQEIREQFIHELSTNFHLYGINESVGRLYGTLLFENDTLTLDEMSRRLGMSKTSMSTGIRQLVDANMARKVWKKGVRKDLYIGEEDWYASFIAIFSKKWRQGIENNKKASVQMEKRLLALQKEAPEQAEVIASDLKKIAHAKAYYDWLDRFIDFLESGEIFEHLEKN
ncbi:GbsR/MarR family transcriptional regulator [Shouchella clausii]|nr:GbsR/MarR family transcriptional regulator [Shouchella clausii]AST94607.1 GbsR/MarR family transcriptional regulator [Shouchella clausii]MBU8596991.1 GbsR/MarR family transcriptional regulator [Shouchella clausii]MCY1106551.1 GbsR/MarR family transcriptional regulator [Shouchella clausii]MEB5474859.1 GbsR/MarR family transcriptional regulator [Shouchella clausii]MED4159746.1 GbsR/MarR family transcriptional regulator [Shouchella clausii]